MNDPMNSYGTVTGPAEVRFERLLPGPIETIWSFLVDSDKRGEWLAPGPMEARAGGRVTLRFQNADLSPHKAPAPEKYRGSTTRCTRRWARSRSGIRRACWPSPGRNHRK